MKKQPSILLIDPLSTGESMKAYVLKNDFRLLVAYTMSRQYIADSFLAGNDASLFDFAERVFFEKELPDLFSFDVKQEFNLVAVIPCSEPGVELAATLANLYHLPGNCPDKIAASRNKLLMREALEKNKLAVPKYFHSYDYRGAVMRLKNELHYPVVAKTLSGAGTQDVYVCRDDKSFELGFTKVAESLNIFNKKSEGVLVEQYIPGVEYVINGYAVSGEVCVTDIWRYEKFDNDYSANIYYAVILEDAHHGRFAKAKTYVANCAKALGVDLGMFHAEIKFLSSGEPILVELGARFAGMGLPKLCQVGSDFDPYDCALNIFLGKTFATKQASFINHCASLYFPHTSQGRLVEIKGLNEISLLSSYVDHKLHVRCGDFISQTATLNDTPLLLLMANKSKKRLLLDIQRARELFDLITDFGPVVFERF